MVVSQLLVIIVVCRLLVFLYLVDWSRFLLRGCGLFLVSFIIARLLLGLLGLIRLLGNQVLLWWGRFGLLFHKLDILWSLLLLSIDLG